LALERLAEDPPVAPFTETDLNRALYFRLLEAHRDVGPASAPLAPPIPEGRNAPSADHVARDPRENKVPDFQWGLTDHQVQDARKSAKHFVVECKILGTPKRSDWIYNEQYVIGGVVRFVDPRHGYGMGVAEGSMVGYVVDLAIDAARAEVASQLAAVPLPPLSEVARGEDEFREFTHELERAFDESPYELRHHWRRVSQSER
jgi:hypothetical protein